MKAIRWLLLAVIVAIIIVFILTVLPVQSETVDRVQVNTEQTCPPDTDKGAYHSRGYDKDGNISCGFTYFNECPYYAGAEAGTPECEKGKPTPEQLERWQPEPQPESTQTPEYGGK